MAHMAVDIRTPISLTLNSRIRKLCAFRVDNFPDNKTNNLGELRLDTIIDGRLRGQSIAYLGRTRKPVNSRIYLDASDLSGLVSHSDLDMSCKVNTYNQYSLRRIRNNLSRMTEVAVRYSCVQLSA